MRKDLDKRQFELKMKNKLLRKFKLKSTKKLSKAERQSVMLAELRKRRQLKRCPICLQNHFNVPPDSCWIAAFRSGHQEIIKAFDAYLRKNKWGKIEGLEDI